MGGYGDGRYLRALDLVEELRRARADGDASARVLFFGDVEDAVGFDFGDGETHVHVFARLWNIRLDRVSMEHSECRSCVPSSDL